MTLNLVLLHEQKERYERDYETKRWDLGIAPFGKQEDLERALAEIDGRMNKYNRDFYADQTDDLNNGRPDRQHTA